MFISKNAKYPLRLKEYFIILQSIFAMPVWLTTLQRSRPFNLEKVFLLNISAVSVNVNLYPQSALMLI